MSRKRRLPSKQAPAQVPRKKMPVAKPKGTRFGTNPAQGESHVQLEPELMHPFGGDKGYLDDFQETMLA